MDWRSVKTTLIVFLLLINLILATVYLSRRYEIHQSEQLYIQNTVELLGKRGVSVDASLFSPEQPALYTLEIRREAESDRVAYEGLIGPSEAQDQGSGITLLSGPFGEARLLNAGVFSVEFNDAFESSVFPDPEAAAAVFKKMGIAEFQDVLRTEASEDGVAVHGMQRLRGQKIFNCVYQLVFGEDGLVEMSGRRILGEPLVSDANPSCSATTALLQFTATMEEAGTPCRSVLSAELGYACELSAPGYSRLFPVWRVESDVGLYYIDANTLALIRQLP